MASSPTTTRVQNPATGYILLVAGILCLVGGGLAIAPAVQSHSDPAGWSLALLFGGFLACVFGGIQIYDSQPLPADPIRAPQPLQLVQDEPWRKNTSLRYLEKLKEEVASLEKEASREYTVAADAYEKLSKASGRIEYNRLQREKRFAESTIPNLEKDITALKKRIETICSGNVQQEILTIKENIKKLERSNQENQRTLADLDKPCTIQHKYQSDVNYCERTRAEQRARLRRYIHDNDNRTIELQTDQEELQNYDFKNLWKSIGKSAAAAAGLTAIDKNQLQDMKDKADILQSFPTLVTPAPKPSAEEERRTKEKVAEARLRRHQQQKKDALEDILQSRRLEDLSAEEQDDYKEEENSWNDTIRHDREELRKLQR